MRTPTTRRQHRRDHLRYETDLTDAEWAVVEPMLPVPLERAIRRNGICVRSSARSSCVLRGGILWRLIPKDLLPKSTVLGYFGRLRDEGV